ncbi:MAG: hypothetical protein Q4G16_12880 [Cruoricaptor ignavus]|nr:hypothetical protein [Cruoricaptor ignavus]
MTFQEFDLKIKRENRQDKIWNYMIATLAIIGSTFFLYQLTFSEWYEIKKLNGKSISKSILYLISLIFLLIGIYGFWKIPNLYKFTKIECTNNEIENQKFIKKTAKDLNMTLIEARDNFYHYHYFGKLRNPFNVYFFTDKNIFINVKQIDLNGGYFDFGISKKVRNKIIQKMTNQ